MTGETYSGGPEPTEVSPPREPMGPDKAPPKRRRWRSSQQAYETGYARGFMAATELLRILRNPDQFIEDIHEIGSTFAKTLHAMSDVDKGDSGG